MVGLRCRWARRWWCWDWDRDRIVGSSHSIVCRNRCRNRARDRGDPRFGVGGVVLVIRDRCRYPSIEPIEQVLHRFRHSKSRLSSGSLALSKRDMVVL